MSETPELPEEPSQRYLNRELSWLDFNGRVIALAQDHGLALLERVKFCAIASSNLDEFFQVRVAALKDQVAAGIHAPSPDGRTPAQQLLEIGDRVETMIDEQEQLLLRTLMPALAAAGLGLLRWDDLERTEAKQLVDVFEQRIFPVLTPLAVDPAHPFPYISSLSLNLAVIVRDPATGDRRFARVKVPPSLPRFQPVPGGRGVIALEDIIAAQLGALFPGMDIVDRWAFRVTRNADLSIDEDNEEAEDLLAAVEVELRRRRFGKAVRLEVAAGMAHEIVDLLVEELDLDADDVSYHEAPLDLRDLMQLTGADRPDLRDEPWPSVTPAALGEADAGERSIFSVLRERDVLVHHPYESFTASVEEFVRQAADDPKVLSIKTTLYRTSGDSPIARSLIRAAERGVQVAALVELKARFDELRNITWARALERAGVHVVYGLVGLKTHAKCMLVVRQEDDALRRYLHVGTGNYNPSTARTYEDVGLLTSDPDLAADLQVLFNHLTGYSRNVTYRKLVDAPERLRGKVLELIENEAAHGDTGRIAMKMNAVVDPEMIDALYFASLAGVRVDLQARGICCLRPGVPGMSENIRVRSVLGRYLEHSRILHFANGDGPGAPCWYISSADLMPRNLDRRVEIMTPIEDPAQRDVLAGILESAWAPDVPSWSLGPDGSWTAMPGRQSASSQRLMYDAAVVRGQRG